MPYPIKNRAEMNASISQKSYIKLSKTTLIKLKNWLTARFTKDIMHILTKVFLFNFLILNAINACAKTDLSFMKQGTSYYDARKTLVDKGWKPVKNMNMNNSSLYAQEIYLQGLEEVVDCISMELDACTFRFSQKNRVLDVKTITRQLNLESFKNYKKR